MTDRNYTLEIPPGSGFSCTVTDDGLYLEIKQKEPGYELEERIVLNVHEVAELSRYLPTAYAALRGE